MGLVTFSMFHLFFSLETSDEERTLFSSELLENPILLKTSALSLLTIFLATTFGPLQRVLDTDGARRRASGRSASSSAASIIVVAEVRKFLRRRTITARPAGTQPALAAPAS